MPECGEVYDSADEYDRDERIETIYQGWGAREMAERIVELEDELGADVDGICTGMHADVAEAHAEIERLTSLVGYWEYRAEESDRLREHAGSLYEMFKRLRDEEADRADRFESAWKSARLRAKTAMGAWRYTQWRVDQHDEERRADGELQRFLWGQLTERSASLRRYRSAWISARRRAADEANFGMEALDRERARQASFVAELQPLLKRRMEEVRRHRAFVDEVTHIRGWCMTGDVYHSHLTPIYEALRELDEAQRESRPFRARLERQAIRGDFEEVTE